MSSFSSHSRRLRLSTKPNQTESVKSIFAGHHATVNCLECHRTMVPRVVTYYGQPLRSICPFCGATFAKFPSRLQKFLSRIQSRSLSANVLNKLLILTLSFVLLWLISDQISVSGQLSLFAFFGTVIFGTTLLAEIVFQSIEYLAARFSHKSNYYWATLVLAAMMSVYFYDDITSYIGAFFLIMMLRGLVVGVIQSIDISL